MGAKEEMLHEAGNFYPQMFVTGQLVHSDPRLFKQGLNHHSAILVIILPINGLGPQSNGFCKIMDMARTALR